MPKLEEIKNDVRRLPKAEQEALRDWLENMLEDGLEFTDEFKAKIERGEQEIREGRIRVHEVQTLADCDRRALERFQMLDAMEG